LEILVLSVGKDGAKRFHREIFRPLDTFGYAHSGVIFPFCGGRKQMGCFFFVLDVWPFIYVPVKSKAKKIAAKTAQYRLELVSTTALTLFVSIRVRPMSMGSSVVGLSFDAVSFLRHQQCFQRWTHTDIGSLNARSASATNFLEGE
jgi:hypothetical protein